MKKIIVFALVILSLLTSLISRAQQPGPQLSNQLMNAPAPVLAAATSFETSGQGLMLGLVFTGSVYNLSGASGPGASTIPGPASLFVATYRDQFGRLWGVSFLPTGQFIGLSWLGS